MKGLSACALLQRFVEQHKRLWGGTEKDHEKLAEDDNSER